MVLQPLVLVLVIDEVGEQFPVPRRVLVALNHKVVTFVSEIRHNRHAHDSVFDMDQFLEAKRIRSNWNLGVTDFENSMLSWTDQLNDILVRF